MTAQRKAHIPNGGKRLGMEKSEWLDDWFVSHSPRNSNSNAEGPWDQWVDMAVQILQHPATAITRPDAHQAAAELPVRDYYDQVDRTLTEDELTELFQ